MSEQKGRSEMKCAIVGMFMTFAVLLLLCSGCASGDGGAVVGGVLQGVGAGLSGL